MSTVTPFVAPNPAARLLALLYAALIVYGTLYPFTDWRTASGMLPNLGWPERVSRSDMLINLLAYMPLGLALALGVRGRAKGAVMATLLGFGLSTTLELLQTYLPARVPSLLDVLLNTAGSTAGAMLAGLLAPYSSIGRWTGEWRARWLLPGPSAIAGVIAIGLWTLAQTSPLVPSIDVGNLREGLSPLYQALRASRPLQFGQLAAYACAIFALGAMLLAMRDEGIRRNAMLYRWGLFVAVVLALKVPIVTRQLSLEAVLGALLAFAALALLPMSRTVVRYASGFGVILYAVAEAIRPGVGPTLPFSWNLFGSQMLNIHGLADILAGMWPGAALAALAVLAGVRARPVIVLAGALAIGAASFALELAQQQVPGRHGDITDTILPLVAWLVTWLICAGEPLLTQTLRPRPDAVRS